MNLFNAPKLLNGLQIRFGENPMALLALFTGHATKQQWSEQEIENVLRTAKKGNYMNLIKTLRAHIHH